MAYQGQRSQRSIIRIGKAINRSMQRVATSNIVVNFYNRHYQRGPSRRNKRVRQKLTCGLDEALVILTCKQWIRQVSKELLEQASDAVHIVKEVRGIAEIDLVRV